MVQINHFLIPSDLDVLRHLSGIVNQVLRDKLVRHEQRLIVPFVVLQLHQLAWKVGLQVIVYSRSKFRLAIRIATPAVPGTHEETVSRTRRLGVVPNATREFAPLIYRDAETFFSEASIYRTTLSAYIETLELMIQTLGIFGRSE